jgi:hypothetical protein
VRYTIADPTLEHQVILSFASGTGDIRVTCNCREELGIAKDFGDVVCLYDSHLPEGSTFRMTA